MRAGGKGGAMTGLKRSSLARPPRERFEAHGVQAGDSGVRHG